MLMLLLFVGGIMNMAWIAAVAAFVFVEKVSPAGHWIGRFTGLLLVVWGEPPSYFSDRHPSAVHEQMLHHLGLRQHSLHGFMLSPCTAGGLERSNCDYLGVGEACPTLRVRKEIPAGNGRG